MSLCRTPKWSVGALLLGLWAVVGTLPALAVQPGEMLDDPVLESRAREISKELRCVVCPSQNIDESNADLARDLRLLVRDRLRQGDSNQEVIGFIVARYGNYVLLRPPFTATTYALWFGPLLFALLAAFGAWRFYRPPASAQSEVPPRAAADAPAAPLSDAEKKRLGCLLKNEDGA